MKPNNNKIITRPCERLSSSFGNEATERTNIDSITKKLVVGFTDADLDVDLIVRVPVDRMHHTSSRSMYNLQLDLVFRIAVFSFSTNIPCFSKSHTSISLSVTISDIVAKRHPNMNVCFFASRSGPFRSFFSLFSLLTAKIKQSSSSKHDDDTQISCALYKISCSQYSNPYRQTMALRR